jgi:hypothetical protein
VTSLPASSITGQITGSQIAADAIDGKTITGATLQTAASGQRVVLNSSNLRAIGSNGATIGIDPNATYPLIYWTSADLSNQAVINVTGTASDANIGTNSGTFVDAADSVTYKWRTFLGRDFYAAERVRQSDSQPVGGRLFMTKNTASLGSGPGGGTVAVGTGTATVTAADIRMAGLFRADSISHGLVNITPTPNVPTSVTLSGGNITGNTFHGFVTANTGAPGTVVTGVSCTAVTSAGMVVWITRTTNVTTTVYWMIIGDSS